MKILLAAPLLLLTATLAVAAPTSPPACRDNHANVGSDGQYYDISDTYGLTIWSESNGVPGLQRDIGGSSILLPSDTVSDPCTDTPGLPGDLEQAVII